MNARRRRFERRTGLETTGLDNRQARRLIRNSDKGCRCTVICSMGPTCPGGMLAGLEGSGCTRYRHESQATP